MSKAGAGDSAKKAPKPKLNPAAEKAVGKLKHVEDGILTLQGVLGGYLREVQEVREKIEGGKSDQ